MSKVVHAYHYVYPGGGPPGYLWNLKAAIDSCGEDVKALIDVRTVHADYKDFRKPNIDCLKRYSSIRFLHPLVVSYGTIRRLVRKIPKPALEQYKHAKVTVLHSADFAAQFLRSFGEKTARQKLLLMPHAPTDEAEEVSANWAAMLGFKGSRPRYLQISRRLLAKAELAVFERVDGLIVPYRESLEAYFFYDSRLRELFEAHLDRLDIFEIPTGRAPLPHPSVTCQEARAKLGLPQDKIIVGFFGRYHVHKGFPLYRALVEYADQRDDNLFFISIGQGEEPLPDAVRYKNLGWIDHAVIQDILVAVDLVLFPNAVAYFDAGLIEALSAGKLLLVRNVGGHRRLSSPGVIKLDSDRPEDWYTKIQELLVSDKKHLETLSAANRRVFDEEYSEHVFLQRHLKLARELIK